MSSLVAFAGQSPAQLAAPRRTWRRRGRLSSAAQLQLTPEQKTVIYDGATGRWKGQAPGNVRDGQRGGAPATEHFLPDSALATAPEAKAIKYTVAQNRVVLVDPTTMRVVDVISQH